MQLQVFQGDCHKPENICWICRQKGCRSSCDVCSVCVVVDHFHHDVLLLGKFFEELELKKDSLRSLRSCLQLLTAKKQEIISATHNVTEAFLAAIKRLELKVEEYFANAKNEIEDKLKNQCEEIIMQIRGSEINASIKRSLPQLVETVNTTEHLKEEVQVMDLRLEEFHTQQKSMLQNMLGSIQTNFDNLITSFPTHKILVLPQRFVGELPDHIQVDNWSPKLKHPNINIKSRRATRTQTDTIEAAAALSSIALTDANKQYRWKCRMNRVAGAIYVGMCLQSAVVSHGLILGHGHYLIRTNGTIYSSLHGEKRVSEDRQIRFETMDVIEFVYSPMKKTLRIEKQSTRKVLQLEVEDPPEGQRYRACAYLLYLNAEVEYI